MKSRRFTRNLRLLGYGLVNCLFVNDDAVRDLGISLRPGDELTIMQALSGG